MAIDFTTLGTYLNLGAWLASRHEYIIYAHNCQYDIGNLFPKDLDALDFVLVGTRMIKATWGKKIFADSFNIWPMALRKLGPAFGLEKLETDVLSREYCERDVEILHRAMTFGWKFR